LSRGNAGAAPHIHYGVGSGGPLNLAAEELPICASRRLRAETMFICRLAVRLADRLANPIRWRTGGADPEGWVLSLLRALGALVWR